jgi:hypothetical protein
MDTKRIAVRLSPTTTKSARAIAWMTAMLHKAQSYKTLQKKSGS